MRAVKEQAIREAAAIIVERLDHILLTEATEDWDAVEASAATLEELARAFTEPGREVKTK